MAHTQGRPAVSRPVTITLPEDVVEWIDDKAQREQRTRSNYITHVLTQAWSADEKAR